MKDPWVYVGEGEKDVWECTGCRVRRIPGVLEDEHERTCPHRQAQGVQLRIVVECMGASWVGTVHGPDGKVTGAATSSDPVNAMVLAMATSMRGQS